MAATVAVGVGVVLARSGRERRDARRRSENRRLGLLGGERPSDGMRRMALEQLDLAIELLASGEASPMDEEAVHETRKALKRLRALLRLVRAEIGEEAFAREDRALRDAGRALSGARDGEVMLATLDDLIARHRGLLAGRRGVERLHAQLARERAEAQRLTLEDPSARIAALASLRACRSRVAVWRLPDGRGIRLLEPGLLRLYRQGRSRYRRAARRGGRDLRRMHEWRKRVKDLRYAAEMLDSPEARGDRLARRADELGELLGEDHDLGVLDGWIREQRRTRKGRPRRAGRRSAKVLRQLIARRRRKLQRRALRKGERLYRARPKKFLRGVRAARRGAAGATRPARSG